MPSRGWTRISLAEASRESLLPIEFCVPNLMAGSVGVVAAPPGIGKTCLLMQIGAAVAAGIPVANGAMSAPGNFGRVVMLAAEDPPAVLNHRAYYLVKSLCAQGYDGDVIARLEKNFEFISWHGPAPKILSESNLSEPALDRLTAFAKGAKLLILDPIRKFHWCNEDDYGRMSLLFELLSDIAAREGCTILFSHHVNRPHGSDETPDIAEGASAFVNATRWVLNMHTMSKREAGLFSIPEDMRHQYVRINLAKSNYGPQLDAVWLRRSPEFEGIFELASLDRAVS